jgi:hypothetical protein
MHASPGHAADCRDGITDVLTISLTVGMTADGALIHHATDYMCITTDSVDSANNSEMTFTGAFA